MLGTTTGSWNFSTPRPSPQSPGGAAANVEALWLHLFSPEDDADISALERYKKKIGHRTNGAQPTTTTI
eukprot:scaffold18441_cov30-Tisochrysis_lutea.AAC.4